MKRTPPKLRRDVPAANQVVPFRPAAGRAVQPLSKELRRTIPAAQTDPIAWRTWGGGRNEVRVGGVESFQGRRMVSGVLVGISGLNPLSIRMLELGAVPVGRTFLTSRGGLNWTPPASLGRAFAERQTSSLEAAPPIPFDVSLGLAGYPLFREALPYYAGRGAGLAVWQQALANLAAHISIANIALSGHVKAFGGLDVTSSPEQVLANSRDPRALAVWVDAAKKVYVESGEQYTAALLE